MYEFHPNLTTLLTDINLFFIITSISRPSAIPGPIPDELVVPTSNSIGIVCSDLSNVDICTFNCLLYRYHFWTGMTLLMKMGWRQGRSIRDSHADSLYGMAF